MKKLKKNKKGFTFVELLAAIVILSILASIGIVAVNGFLSSAKEKYYKSQEDLITLAGKQYFTDYRSELPKEIGNKSSVSIETLYSQKYLDKVKDYNGNQCETINDSTSNKVYAIKTDAGSYKYYTIFKCADYTTTVDNKAPVITFTPSSATTNKDIDVVIKITDNVGVDSFYYEITKDGTTYKKITSTSYTEPVTVTINDEGKYIIKVRATDKSGNITDKSSKEYIISKTGPDCSKFVVVSTNDSIKEKWQSKDAKLRITPPSNVKKWDFERCFIADDNKTRVCTAYGTNLMGAKNRDLKGSEKFYISTDVTDIDDNISNSTDDNSTGEGNNSNTPDSNVIEVTYNDQGHFFGHIKAYDEFGNSCSLDTDTYYIDKDAPTIKEMIVVSKEEDYNSLDTYINLSIEDRDDKTDSKLYYMISNDADFKNSTWQSYNEGADGYQAVDWSFAGEYDGNERTVYIKVKDELENISDTYTTYYTVYKECEDDNLENQETKGSCSGTCGSQVIETTIKSIDVNTKKQCSSKKETESCSTDECGTPACSITLSGGTVGTNGWYRGGTVTYTLNPNKATTSYGIGRYNSKKSGTVNSNGTYTITGYVKNKDGKEARCSKTIKYDKTAPTCTHNKESTTWSNKNYHVYKGCADTGGSGCVKTLYGDAIINYTKKVQNFGAYTIKDKAGNTRNCPAVKLNIYVDKDAPTVVVKKYTNYRGNQCIDNPYRLYKNRYNVSMADSASGLKITSCSWEKPTVTRSGSSIRTATIIENLCQDSKGVSCKACDYAGNCRTVSKN